MTANFAKQQNKKYYCNFATKYSTDEKFTNGCCKRFSQALLVKKISSGYSFSLENYLHGA
jgi:hypothetical protein